MKYLGIMTMPSVHSPPFAEKANFAILSRAGDKLSITVIVFFPDQVDFKTRTVWGYRYLPTGRWIKKKFPLPTLIYDRFFHTGKEGSSTKRKIKQLKKDPQIQFLGLGLSGKWQMYQLISGHKDEKIRSFLPETELVYEVSTIEKWLSRYKDIILKPVMGSLGKGVLRINQQQGLLKLSGRNLHNHLIEKIFYSKKDLLHYLSQLCISKRYLVQPYLRLTTPDGEPFDVRILVQKNHQGNWSCTGMAVRKGQEKGVTSNLHGGGRAFPFQPFLTRYYDGTKRERILEQINLLINEVPSYMEACHGPLVELGIDIGIDRDGNVWLIEINSKPGRKIFHQLKEAKLRKQAVLNPILYARHMMHCDTGG